MTEKLCLSVPEVAQVLGCSVPVAYQIVKQEGFPAIKLSARRITVPISALQRWLDEQAGMGV